MQTRGLQVKDLSIDQFIAVIVTITGEKLVKAEGFLVYGLVVWRCRPGENRYGHQVNLAQLMTLVYQDQLGLVELANEQLTALIKYQVQTTGPR